MKLVTISFLLLLSSSYVSGQSQKHPYVATIQLRNCNKEMRVIPFVEPLTFFDRWIRGLSKLEDQKILKFSADYIIDSNYLRDGVRKIRTTLPNNFWGVREGEKWYDNEPNDDAIWFIKLFVQVDKVGEMKILSAYKITFEGNDARIFNQREGKIKNIEFILDKAQLSELKNKLKKATEVF